MKETVWKFTAMVTGAALGAFCVGKLLGKRLLEEMKQVDKMQSLFSLMLRWVKAKQEGKKISEYLKKKGYETVAIYGMGNVGTALYEELRGSDVKVRYGVDRNRDHVTAEIDIFSASDDLPDVDALIVTPISFFEEIKGSISVHGDIISLQDIMDKI